MRELKFRIWDNLKKCWVSNKSIWRINTDNHGIGEISPPISFKQHPQGLTIQQYTGLIDVNGKEIYEGDIVYWNCGTHGSEFDPYREFYQAVHFEDGCFFAGDFMLYNMIVYVNVAGNILENKELLKL